MVFKFTHLHARYHSGESQRYAQSTVAPFRTCSACPGSKLIKLIMQLFRVDWTYRWFATVHACRAGIVRLRGGDVVLWDPVARAVDDDAGANSWPASLSPSVRFGDYFFNYFLHCGGGVSWTLVSRYNVSNRSTLTFLCAYFSDSIGLYSKLLTAFTTSSVVIVSSKGISTFTYVPKQCKL